MVETGQAGFASIDALVALVILSFATVLSLDTLQQAGRAAQSAAEVREARTLLIRLMEEAPLRLDTTLGRTAAFGWQVETQPTAEQAPIAICRRIVRLKHRETGRAYLAASLTACPPKEGS